MLNDFLSNLKTFLHKRTYMSQTSSVNDAVAVGNLDSQAKGTGARKSGGKVNFLLVPWHLLAGTARVLTAGTIKYKEWNWAKGMPWSECAKCIVRHFIKWWFFREDYDEESGEHHLDHIMCNVLFLRHYDLVYKEGDDRPPAFTGFDEQVVMEWAFQKFDEEAYRERNDLNVS